MVPFHTFVELFSLSNCSSKRMKNDVQEEIGCQLVCGKNIYAWSTLPCEVPFSQKQGLLDMCLHDWDGNVLFHASISHHKVLQISGGGQSHGGKSKYCLFFYFSLIVKTNNPFKLFEISNHFTDSKRNKDTKIPFTDHCRTVWPWHWIKPLYKDRHRSVPALRLSNTPDQTCSCKIQINRHASIVHHCVLSLWPPDMVAART